MAWSIITKTWASMRWAGLDARALIERGWGWGWFGDDDDDPLVSFWYQSLLLLLFFFGRPSTMRAMVSDVLTAGLANAFVRALRRVKERNGRRFVTRIE